MGLVTLLAGCIFVSEAEYLDKEADLQDADGDGFVAEAYGGNDCDDGNPTIFPGATDTWYDGVDTDCAGNDDYDADGDGSGAASYGEGDDCDDTDVEFGPHVDETWYDGIDSDCDGADDYDADGDGFVSDDYEGFDCDDADPDTNPEAEEVWYDGIDQDCGGEDGDYDADGDGYDAEGKGTGGTDCDDADASRSPDSPEIYGDGFDADCDGGDATMWLDEVSVMLATGIAGPVLHESGGYVVVGFGASEVNYYGLVYDSVCYVAFDDEIYTDGQVDESCLTWPTDYGDFGSAFDFFYDGSWAGWNSMLYDFGYRLWYIDLTDEEDSFNPSGAHRIEDGETERVFSQASVSVVDRQVTGVVCDSGTGDLWAVTNDADNTIDACTGNDCEESVVTLAGSDYDACEVRADDGLLLLSDRDAGTVSAARVTDNGLDPVGDASLDGGVWDVTAIASRRIDGQSVTVFGDATAGLVVHSGSSSQTSPTTRTFVHLDVALGGGDTFVCGVADDGTAWLFSGSSDLIAPLSAEQLVVEDAASCSVLYTSERLHVVVRAADKIQAGSATAG